MQFSRFRKQKLTGERDPYLYPHALQFYKYVPEVAITLEEFEKLALERLQVLRIIERVGNKFRKISSEYKEAIYSELKKLNLHVYYKITVDDDCTRDDIYDERKRDHVSHFILRLAYCRSDFLRSWFINQEVELFRVRFVAETSHHKKRFMELNHLDYKPIDKHEKKSLFAQLVSCQFQNSSSKVESTDFYKVPFTEVLDLVVSRKVYLQDGYAYIPDDGLVSIVVSAFRSHLSQSLALTARILPQLQEDRRLLNILKSIHDRYLGTDYTKKPQFSGEVVPEMLDGLSKTSFPLCMRSLHDYLRKTHHLKYFGRLQYGLFLKGIGLTLEDSMRFWREEFVKTMDVDKFERQYAYGIRYNYGKEGKRANFTPYSCMKIITTNPPGPMDCHGCPFKHSDTENLRQMLTNLHIGSSAISNILDLSSKGHPQLACTRYFEVTHNETTVNQAISHPNQYFEESQKFNKGETGKSLSQVSTSPVVVYDNNGSSSQNTADCDINDYNMDDIEDLLKGI